MPHGRVTSLPSFPWSYGYLHGKKNPLQVSLPPGIFVILLKSNILDKTKGFFFLSKLALCFLIFKKMSFMNVKKGWNYSLLYLDLFFRWSRDKDKLEMMIFIIYTNFLFHIMFTWTNLFTQIKLHRKSFLMILSYSIRKTNCVGKKICRKINFWLPIWIVKNSNCRWIF